MFVENAHIFVKIYVSLVKWLLFMKKKKKLDYGENITNVMYAKVSASESRYQ